MSAPRAILRRAQSARRDGGGLAAEYAAKLLRQTESLTQQAHTARAFEITWELTPRRHDARCKLHLAVGAQALRLASARIVVVDVDDAHATVKTALAKDENVDARCGSTFGDLPGGDAGDGAARPRVDAGGGVQGGAREEEVIARHRQLDEREKALVRRERAVAAREAAPAAPSAPRRPTHEKRLAKATAAMLLQLGI